MDNLTRLILLTRTYVRAIACTSTKHSYYFKPILPQEPFSTVFIIETEVGTTFIKALE